ncbi:lysin A [Corynebacterium phage EmiRose]|uniref:lysozyme n=1 Tax=Corynebacterium phage EmiRose TaxID=2565372 RepID=A0A649VPH1_9CAUD|nr:lysin A [Corynebacterium phage EmiRose]QGJ94151.1 lysin A [Corynebacterium phage EmiRose]
MTIFGVDVSEWQNGMSLRRAKDEGIQFAIIRTNDGTYADRFYLSHLQDAENAGLLTAAYIYLRNPNEGSSIERQVQTTLNVMGNSRRPIWLDCETNAGLHPDHIREAKRRFEAAGVHVPGAYSYVPWWEGKVVGGEPDSHEFGKFWVAAYGRNASGSPKDIYPGDNHYQWAYPVGNQLPVLWQFGSNASVAGFSVDINAFKGSVEELRAIFYGIEGDTTNKEEPELSNQQVEAINAHTRAFITGYLGPQIDAIQDIWQQLRGRNAQGWPQLGQNEQGQNLSLVDGVGAIRQDNADIAKRLDAIEARLDSIDGGK